jgi:hypothetical protein
MSQKKPADPPVPAKITEVKYEPVDHHDDQFWSEPGAKPPRAPMSFSGRMFNVGWKGWVRLALICIFVGAIFQAGGFNPFAAGFTVGAGAGQILDGLIKIATWAAQLSAMPLLLGALVVAPLWLIWRALLALFNKDKPPGPDDRILPKERKKAR